MALTNHYSNRKAGRQATTELRSPHFLHTILSSDTIHLQLLVISVEFVPHNLLHPDRE